MFNAVINKEYSFKVEEDEMILDAALRQNINIPYSCKSGRCNTCKIKLDDGNINLEGLDQGLREEDREEGYILSCTSAAKSDLSLSVDELLDFELPKSKLVPSKIKSINYLKNDVIELKLRFPPNVDFSFMPGQYVDLIGPGGMKRSYSIANSSFADRELCFHIKRINDGQFSNYWFNVASQDDLIRVEGPKGTFVLRSKPKKNLIFLATGTGIAPVCSILDDIFKSNAFEKYGSIYLFWGGRYLSDQYLDVSAIYPNIQYFQVVSREKKSHGIYNGYVQDILISQDIELSNSSIYACGSNDMIISASKALSTYNNFNKKEFFSDAFLPS